MTSFYTHLLSAREIAESTVEYILQRPDGFAFQAGQHVNLKLQQLNHEDKKGLRRTFTIASAPYEESIHIVTRDTGSGFKRTLREGVQTVEMLGPLGKLTRDPNVPAVFIAGGVGITPFRSMVLDSLHNEVAAPMTLLYSNRAVESAVFLPLFQELAANDQYRFTLHFLQTGGETGQRIDGAFIRANVTRFDEAIFYLCGPQGMVEAMRDILKNMEVVDERVRFEIFWGY